MNNNLKNIADMISGKLIVGNNDTITIYGSDAQRKVNEYTKLISKYLLNNNFKPDEQIKEVLSAIDNFQNCIIKSNNKSLFSKQKKLNQTREKYYQLCEYIKNITNYFQLKKTHLLKELKMLEKISEAISECLIQLENDIKEGNKVLSRQSEYNPSAENQKWFERLQRKMQDLQITHTVSLQNKTEVNLLYDNNLVLIDNIERAITNTFPMWQNQVSMLLEIDILQNRIGNNDKVLKTINMKKADKQIDENSLKELSEINEKLSSALLDMNKFETADLNLRKKITIKQ